jgi:hypothetical protein
VRKNTVPDSTGDYRPRYPVTQFDMVAEQIVHHEIGGEAEWFARFPGDSTEKTGHTIGMKK